LKSAAIFPITMKRLIIFIALIAILVSLLSLGVADASTSIADTSVPDNEIASGVNEAGNPNSASASIVITMYTLAEE